MSGTKHAPPVDPEVGLLDVEESAGAEIVLAGEGDDSGAYPARTFRKIGTGMATLVALILATYLVPALHFARPWTAADPVPFWNLVGREFMGQGAEAAAAEAQLARAEALAKAAQSESDAPIEDRRVVAPPPGGDTATPSQYEPHPDDALDVPRSLELPDPNALDPFFARLEQTEAGYEGAVTRVVHWGDSVLGTDNVSSALREKMQRRFGDAGHGFHLLAKNNPSYRHRGVRFSGGKTWSVCHIIVNCKKDGYYGLGATTVWSGGGARSKFSTATKTSNGRKMSRFELWYAGRPGGGKIRIDVDGGEPIIVETAADAFEDRWHLLEFEDGEHSVEVRADGGGRVRAYGVVMERDGPGLVWDGMSQVGAFASRMLLFEPEHLLRQIDHRDPALLVFQFGGNDLTLRESKRERFKEQFAQMLRNFRGTDPARACLVISPVDHGVRVRGMHVESMDGMDWITDTEREVALAEGCAYFDTRAAMGGPNSVAVWRRATPPLISADLAHLTGPGQKALGQMIYLALMETYRGYRQRE